MSMTMKFFRYQEDYLPVAALIGIFSVDLIVYFTAQSAWVAALWFCLSIMPKVAACCWNHHHQHLPTFYQKPLNRLLELVYAFHTGITTNAWVLHHNLGHHVNYLDQTRDESAWKRPNGKTMGELEYTIVIALTGYLRAFKVGLKHPKHQFDFLGMGAVVFTLLAGFVYYNWVNALFVFIAPMVIGYVITCYHTYSHHAGLDTEDHFQASHNIMDSWYNLFTGNLGYHTAHHVKPGLHWSQLPEFHQEIAHKIPAHLFVDPPLIFKLLPRGKFNKKVLQPSL